MGETYLCFLEAAIAPDGSAHSRMNSAGSWLDRAGHGDWWGRALYALGTAAVHAPLAATRRRALTAFSRAARRTSPDLRAMVFAAIGAAEVLTILPKLRCAQRLVTDAVAMMPPTGDRGWPWPEPRLRYGNGAIPEMFLACGAATGNPALTARGVDLLHFLLEIETDGGHFSVTGLQGRDRGQRGHQFDQQPVEIAALADACARAYDVTRDDRWLTLVRMAWDWFLGDNDSSTPMVDLATGAGHDGLTPGGRNENRGAESTLAALRTFQQARRLLGAGRHA